MTATVPAVHLIRKAKQTEEYVLSGITEIDQQIGGLPRGAITEATGPLSSGKTTLLHSCLAWAASRLEHGALIDTAGQFDPATAARAGLNLGRLLWVRCDGDAGKALKAADMILHAGGFGLVCLDLGGVDPRVLNRIPVSYWFRFRRAVESTPTSLLVLGDRPNARSCAACWLEFTAPSPLWSGAPGFRLLRGATLRVSIHKPGRPRDLRLTARAA